MGETIKISKGKCILFLITTLFFFVQTCHALVIDKIVAFGDSLTDNGNLFALTKKVHDASPLVPVIPQDPPYYLGRFTNGLVWAEELAKNLRVPLYDYAYGGSWAESFQDSRQLIPFGLDTQINFYLVQAAPDFNIENHLFVIWSGANDYAYGRKDAEYASTNTVTAIKNQIDILILYGARNFLIFNIPDLSITPAIYAQGPTVSANMSHASSLHNSKMKTMIAKERQENTDVKFIEVDVTKIYGDMVAHPEKYRLKNVKNACYTGGIFGVNTLMNGRDIQSAEQANINITKNMTLQTAYTTSLAAIQGEKPCTNPDEYLFWDGMHPTQVAHKIFATLLLALLAENHIVGQ